MWVDEGQRNVDRNKKEDGKLKRMSATPDAYHCLGKCGAARGKQNFPLLDIFLDNVEPNEN